MPRISINDRRSIHLTAALLFLGQVLLRKEPPMAKLPKDNRRLTRLILDHGGYQILEDGESVVGHAAFWRVRTKVKNRRKDATEELHSLAKAIMRQPSC